MVLRGPACREMCVCVSVCVSASAGRGRGVLRGLGWLLGCLFYQKDCSKAFNKHSTEESCPIKYTGRLKAMSV